MSQRFQLHGPDLVQDTATGLFWPRSANPLGYPVSWSDALAAVADLNRAGFLGHIGWRMPNRVELRSLIDHAQRQPALPAGHPFRDVFLGWCWTSTTKAGQTGYAWNVHLEGGRMFYSRKDEFRCSGPGGHVACARRGLCFFDAAERSSRARTKALDTAKTARCAWACPGPSRASSKRRAVREAGCWTG